MDEASLLAGAYTALTRCLQARTTAGGLVFARADRAARRIRHLVTFSLLSIAIHSQVGHPQAYRGPVTSTDSLRVSPQLVSPLVSTQWLADHLGSESIMVIDATVRTRQRPGGRLEWVSGWPEYRSGHVPGAVFADLLHDFSAPQSDFARPAPERFVEAAAALGLDDETTIVIYDDSLGVWAARLWWLLRSFGHERAAVLDGGFAVWSEEERPIERGEVAPERTRFASTAVGLTPVETAAGSARSVGSVGSVRAVGSLREELWSGKGDVERVVRGETDAVLLFAGSRAVFDGTSDDELSPVSRSRPGHIPGSVHVPMAGLIDPASHRLLRPAGLRERFAPALGRESSRPIIAYCTSGVEASLAALALSVLGVGEVSVYDGSLAEWSADPAAPLVTAA